MDNLNFLSLTMLNSQGMTRADVKREAQKYLDSQGISGQERIDAENQIDELFTKYDGDGDGSLTKIEFDENELVAVDFSDNASTSDGTPTISGGTADSTPTTDTVPTSDSAPTVDTAPTVSGAPTADDAPTVSGTPTTSDAPTVDADPTVTDETSTDKKFTKEEFLNYLKNDAPKELKERLKDIDPEKLYEYLKDEDGNVLLSKLEKLTDDEVTKLVEESKVPEETTPEQPVADVGSVNSGSGPRSSSTPQPTSVVDNPDADTSTNTQPPFNHLQASGTPDEQIQQLEENKNTVRADADSQVAEQEAKMMEALSNEIPPEKMAEYEPNVAEVDANIASQTDALNSAQDSLTTTTAEKDVTDTKRQEKETEATELNTAADKLDSQAAGVKIPDPKHDEETGACTNSAEIAAAQQKKADLEHQAAEKRSEAETAKAEADELAAKVAELDGTIAELSTQITDITATLTGLEQQKATLFEELTKDVSEEAQQTIKDCQTQVNAIKETLSTQIGEIDAAIKEQTTQKIENELKEKEEARAKEKERFDEIFKSLDGKGDKEVVSVSEDGTQTFKDGSTFKIDRDTDGKLIGFEYTSSKDSETEGEKDELKEVFDASGRTTSTEETKADGSKTKTDIKYNNDGTKTETKVAETKDGEITRTTTTFDEKGREKIVDTTTASGSEEKEITYNDDGTKTERTAKYNAEDEKISEATIEFDKENKPISKTTVDEFDEMGNPTKATRIAADTLEETSITYNSNGTRTEETKTKNAAGEDVVVTREFDENNKLTSEATKADGDVTPSVTTFGYSEGIDKPTSRTETVDGKQVTTAIEYKADGTRTETTPNAEGSSETVKTFDKQGRVTAEETKSGDTPMFQETTSYIKDAQGNETTQKLTTEYNTDGKPLKVVSTKTDAEGKKKEVTEVFKYKEGTGELEELTTTKINDNPGENEVPKTVKVQKAGSEITTFYSDQNSTAETDRFAEATVIWTGNGLERELTIIEYDPSDPSKSIKTIIKYDANGKEIEVSEPTEVPEPTS